MDCEAAGGCAVAEDPVGVVGGGTEVIRFIGFFLIRARIGLPCGSKKKGLSKVAMKIIRSSDGDDRRRPSGFAETFSLLLEFHSFSVVLFLKVSKYQIIHCTAESSGIKSEIPKKRILKKKPKRK